VGALFGALALLVLFRRYYILGRWTSLFRGGGAPGFIAHYAVRLLLLVEITRELDPSGALTAHLGTAFAIDFGLILLCSGIYKCVAGYLRGEGMEYGLSNPMWGYAFDFFRRLRPSNLLLRLQDAFAASCQVVMGVCMVVPPLRPVGALLCMGSFLFLMPLVRLGRLAALMVVLPVLMLGDLVPRLDWVPESTRLFGGAGAAPWIIQGVYAIITAYIVLVPIVKAVQYLNLYGNRSAPEPFQTWLTRFANWVPIIVWRVFTPDVTNFFIRISARSADDVRTVVLDEETYRYHRSWDRPWMKLRFLHVTESIALTTVFTTLKYFRSDRSLFESKLVQYARTLGLPDGAVVRFEYVSIVKGEAAFEYRPTVAFTVCLLDGTVTEEKLVESFDPGDAAPHSPIRETTGYGSYVAR
jgi:hypothetical protein